MGEYLSADDFDGASIFVSDSADPADLPRRDVHPGAHPYDWRPTYADLDAQVRALHRQVGELHLATARAMEARIHAGLREETARREQVEAETAVERARAVLEAWRAYGADSANGVRRLVAELDQALDGAPPADGADRG